MIPLFLFLGLMAFIFLTLSYSMSQGIHKSMTIDSTDSWDYGTFEDFKREFSKYKWSKQPSFPESLFTNDHDTKIHAGIVRFQGRGMVLCGLDYLRFKLLISNKIKSKREEGIWNKPLNPKRPRLGPRK